MARTPKTKQKTAPKKTAKTMRKQSVATEPIKPSEKITSETDAKTPPPPPPSDDASPDPVSNPGPSPDRATKRAGPWVGVFAVVIILSALGAGVVISRDVWWPYVEAYLPEQPPQEDPRVAVLMERLGALESKVQATESVDDLKDASFQELEQVREKMSAEFSIVMQRLEDVEKSVKAVEQMAAAVTSESNSDEAQESLKTLVDRIKSLEVSKNAMQQQASSLGNVISRLDTLEAQGLDGAKGVSTGISALILAVGQLREVVHQGRPYKMELDSVQKALPQQMASDPEVGKKIEALRAYAENGITSQAVLRNTFPAVSLAALQADRRIEGDGWLSEAINSLGNLITIRRVNDPASDTIDAHLASAESHLAVGDLTAVIKTLDEISGPGAEVVAPWAEQVKASYVVEQALVGLNAIAITQLTAAQE